MKHNKDSFCDFNMQQIGAISSNRLYLFQRVRIFNIGRASRYLKTQNETSHEIDKWPSILY